METKAFTIFDNEIENTFACVCFRFVMFSLRLVGKALPIDFFKPLNVLTENHKLRTNIISVASVRERHNCNRDIKKDFQWKKERPLGPHKHKPPNVAGLRAAENYRHIIHYPEDGKYTIKKLDGKFAICC